MQLITPMISHKCDFIFTLPTQTLSSYDSMLHTCVSVVQHYIFLKKSLFPLVSILFNCVSPCYTNI